MKKYASKKAHKGRTAYRTPSRLSISSVKREEGKNKIAPKLAQEQFFIVD